MRVGTVVLLPEGYEEVSWLTIKLASSLNMESVEECRRQQRSKI